MYIQQLRLTHFRNFSSELIQPSSSFNLLFGANGAGKSSILEALHLLGYGRSFRTSKPDSIIQFDHDMCTAFCKYVENTQERAIGVSRSKKSGIEFNLNSLRTSRISDAAKVLPIQIFTPQSSELITGPPMLRRRYIDWLLFHVEHSFYQSNKSFVGVLSQRNALLKQCQAKSTQFFIDQDVWSPMLADHGVSIDRLREDYISRLNLQLKALYEEFRPDVEVELRYNRGWDSDLSLSDALAHKLERDLTYGVTSVGPHKADIRFLVNKKAASEFLSRGQLRVFVSLLLVAEVRLLKELTGKKCIFLVDDIAAELDEGTREFFLDTIVSEGAQVFVTAIEKEQLPFANKYNNKKVFHVKHDHVIEE